MSEEQEVISVSEYVADHEQLARIIFSPSMVLGEVVAPSAFNLVRLKSGTDEDYAFHAGISYTAGSELIKGHCESPEFLMVTSMLASQSIFVPL